MKNLTIKKVALGLFLAGYAASSAFALDATSSSPINGNKPVMKAVSDNAADHTMTLRITKDEEGKKPIVDQDNPTRKPKVGDYIHIKYKLIDADGDTDAADKLMKTLSVSVKQKTSNTWTEVTSKISPKITHVDAEEATITFKITSDFAGMDYVAYNIKERTDFGLPNFHKWLRVSDIFSGTAPDSSTDATDQTDILTDIVDGTHGPGDIIDGNGTGPIEGENMRIGIYKVSDNGAPDIAVNYALEKNNNEDTPAPKYGDKFTVIVWNEDGTADDVLSQTEFGKELTANYKFEWTVTGTADGVNAEATALTEGLSKRKVENDTIFLGTDKKDGKHNSIYASHTTYKAGLQGFNLKVTAK